MVWVMVQISIALRAPRPPRKPSFLAGEVDDPLVATAEPAVDPGEVGGRRLVEKKSIGGTCVTSGIVTFDQSVTPSFENRSRKVGASHSPGAASGFRPCRGASDSRGDRERCDLHSPTAWALRERQRRSIFQPGVARCALPWVR